MRTLGLTSIIALLCACGTPATQGVPPLSTLSGELPTPQLDNASERLRADNLELSDDNEPDFTDDCRGNILDRSAPGVLTPAPRRRRRETRCLTGGELLDLRRLQGACALRFHLQCTFPQCSAQSALASTQRSERLEVRWQILDNDKQVMWESSSVACDSLDQRRAPRSAWSMLPLLPGAAYVRTVGQRCSACAPRAVLHFEIAN